MAVARYKVVSGARPYLMLLFGLVFGPTLYFMVLGRVYSTLLARAIGGAASVATVGMLVPFAALFLLAKVGPLQNARRRYVDAHDVELGRDGVRLSTLHEHRFLRFDELARITTTDIAVVLRLVSGEMIRLHVWTGATDDDARTRRALAAALEEGRAAQAARVGLADGSVERLARNGRSLREWVGFARGLGRSAAGYRAPGSLREELWSVVEDGAAADDARVAAALALRVEADDGDRLRLAAVAEDSVSPRVRIGVEATEDDEALAEALGVAECPVRAGRSSPRG